MTKKSPTSMERQIIFLSDDFIYEMIHKGIRVTKMMCRGGLGDWLLIVTARIDGESMVLFVGGSDLFAIARKLHEQFVKDELVWTTDKFADKA